MSDVKSPNGFGDGVYFRQEDYASFLRRLSATLIDVVVVYIAAFVLVFVLNYLHYNLDLLQLDEDSVLPLFYVTWGLLTWSYLAICKATSLRTFGYRAAGLKIVTLQGKPVPWYQMTFRLLLWVFGPFSLFLDTLWIFTDEARQSCRDSYSGTLVVKSNAVPEGNGPIRLTFFNVMGMTLMYKRAKRA